MKRRNLIIGASIGIVAGIVGGAIANWVSSSYFSIPVSELPSSHIQTLALCATFFGLLGGLISGLVSFKFGGTKTALLLGVILGFCFGCVGGFWAFLGLLFSS